MMQTPSLVLLSFNEKNVSAFLKYIKSKFELLQTYYNEEYLNLTFEKKNELKRENSKRENLKRESEFKQYDKKKIEEKIEKDVEEKERVEGQEKDKSIEREKEQKKEDGKEMKEEKLFMLRKEIKIKLTNKYYTVDVDVCSCIVKNEDEEAKQTENEIKKMTQEEEEILIEKEDEKQEKHEKQKEIQKQKKTINIKDILCECVIFLFDNFEKNEKDIVNLNPFRNYGEDTLEFIKDPATDKIIKNPEFDFSNFYKDISIKLVIYPSQMEQKDNQIIRFFSEYFIEVLYIDYSSDELIQSNENAKAKDTKKNNMKTKNKFDEYYEDSGERLVEAIHCHMWTGLIQKKKNDISQNKQKLEGEEMLKTEVNELKEVKNKKEQNDNKKMEKEKNEKIEANDKTKQIKENSESDEADIKNHNLFLKNFNDIVEEIKTAKIDNKHCSDDLRREKAEELITKLQQYMCDFDED